MLAPTLPSRSSAGGGLGTDFDCDGGLVTAPTLDGRSGRSGANSFATSGGLIAHTLTAGGHDATEDGTGRGIPLVTFDRQSSAEYGTSSVASTIAARDHKGFSDLVAIPINTQVATRHNALGERTAFGVGDDGDPSFTLGAIHSHAVAFAQNSRDEVRVIGGDDDVTGALAAQSGMKQQTYVAGCFKPGQSADSRSIGYEEEIAPSLEAGGGGNNKPALMHGMAVRRLTPLECERLQGFPDNYTNIPKASDSARYKALGNSMAVPVMRWLGERIDLISKEMA